MEKLELILSVLLAVYVLCLFVKALLTPSPMVYCSVAIMGVYLSDVYRLYMPFIKI